jgi:hypothetical protein
MFNKRLGLDALALVVGLVLLRAISTGLIPTLTSETLQPPPSIEVPWSEAEDLILN